jgi:hypothetical protein
VDWLIAVVGGVVATALWSAAVLMWRRVRTRNALQRFVGLYSINRKLRPDELVGSLAVRRTGQRLEVGYLDNGRGNNSIVQGTITLNERFNKSGRAVRTFKNSRWAFVEPPTTPLPGHR